MKKIILLNIVLASFLFIRCSEEFLEVENKARLTVDNFYTTESQAEMAVVACYDPLKGANFYGLDYVAVGYSFDRDVIVENGVAFYNKHTYSFFATDDQIGTIYHYLCDGVNSCNVALKVIPGIEMKSDKKDILIGQARFMRAMYYFYQTTLFNTPPLALDVVKPIDLDKQVNGTKQGFKKAIVNDLLFAQSVLPESWDDNNLGRATKGAALSMLGKTYLFNEQWDSAKFYLKMVVDLGQYELILPKSNDSANYVAAYLCNFSMKDLVIGSNVYRSENNKESIFELQNNDYNGWQPGLNGYGSNGSSLTSFMSMSGWTNVAVYESFINRFEKNPYSGALNVDPRFYSCVWIPTDTVITSCGSDYLAVKNGLPAAKSVNFYENGVFAYPLKKHYYPAFCGHTGANGNVDPTNWRLIRYSDVLLMLAEALFQNNETSLAWTYLNQVRSRVGLPDAAGVYGTFEEALIAERTVEFALEASVYLDYIRWANLKTRTPLISDLTKYMKKGFVPGKHDYLPIPQIEIDYMKGGLKQNPNW